MNNETKPITYRQLLNALNELGDEQLDMSVTVVLDTEAYPVYDTVLLCNSPSDIKDELLGTLEETQPVLLGSYN